MKIKAVLLITLVFTAVLRGTPTWTVPVPLTEINSSYHDKSPFLSSDGLTIYYAIEDGPTWTGSRIYQAVRPNPLGSFTATTEISTLNPASVSNHVASPWVSSDNLRMYYYQTSGGVSGIRTSVRSDTSQSWLPGSYLTELNGLGSVANPSLTADELTIVFTGLNLPGLGGYDLWMATRTDKSLPFGNAINLISLNSTAWDFHPSFSQDGLTLVFGSRRNGNSEIYMATRSSQDDPFGAPEVLPFFTDQPFAYVEYPFLTAEGQTLYFAKRTLGGETFDLYVSYAVPEPSSLILATLGAILARRRLFR